MVSVSSLYAAILFSGFPFHEEIVASRVTLPFKGEGKRACVLEHKGIHSPTRPFSSNSLDSPHDTHHCRHSRGEILRKPSAVLCSFVKAPRKVHLLRNGSLTEQNFQSLCDSAKCQNNNAAANVSAVRRAESWSQAERETITAQPAQSSQPQTHT